MYTVKCDGNTIYNPAAASFFREDSLISAVVTNEVNKAGSFEFCIPPTHFAYSSMHKLISDIEVWSDDLCLFKGRILNEKTDFYRRKTIYCEGAFAYLNDSVMRPIDLSSHVTNYLRKVLEETHNTQVKENRKLYVGNIYDSMSEHGYVNIKSQQSSYTSCMAEVTQQLINSAGGYLVPRYEKDKTYIDYLYTGTERKGTQTIEFGKNLLSLEKFIDASELYTIILPLGAEIDGANLTVESLNNGSDIIEDEAAVSAFGRITRIVNFDNEKDVVWLKKYAERKLSESVQQSLSLEMTAVDLKFLGVEIDGIASGYAHRVISEPHEIDDCFLCTKRVYNLLIPTADTAAFGRVRKGLTELV